MPDSKGRRPGGVLDLGEPYTIRSWTLILELECRQCQAASRVTVVNDRPSCCPRCKAEYQMGGFRWDVDLQRGQPFVKIAAGPPPGPVN